jgi:hypothetical protein
VVRCKHTRSSRSKRRLNGLQPCPICDCALKTAVASSQLFKRFALDQITACVDRLTAPSVLGIRSQPATNVGTRLRRQLVGRRKRFIRIEAQQMTSARLKLLLHRPTIVGFRDGHDISYAARASSARNGQWWSERTTSLRSRGRRCDPIVSNERRKVSTQLR